MFYISFWKSFLVMTSIQEVVYGVDLASVLKRIDVYHELGGVRRWELQIDDILADALTSEGAGSVLAKISFFKFWVFQQEYMGHRFEVFYDVNSMFYRRWNPEEIKRFQENLSMR
jgi:hypothetical protein